MRVLSWRHSSRDLTMGAVTDKQVTESEIREENKKCTEMHQEQQRHPSY